MEHWHDLDDGGQFSVAGYREIGGTWHDVEKGDTPLEENPTVSEGDLDTAVFHYIDPQGDDVYFTIHGPWDDEDALADYIEYILDSYGI